MFVIGEQKYCEVTYILKEKFCGMFEENIITKFITKYKLHERGRLER
jgi:hypothetical protein